MCVLRGFLSSYGKLGEQRVASWVSQRQAEVLDRYVCVFDGNDCRNRGEQNMLRISRGNQHFLHHLQVQVGTSWFWKLRFPQVSMQSKRLLTKWARECQVTRVWLSSEQDGSAGFNPQIWRITFCYQNSVTMSYFPQGRLSVTDDPPSLKSATLHMNLWVLFDWSEVRHNETNSSVASLGAWYGNSLVMYGEPPDLGWFPSMPV